MNEKIKTYLDKASEEYYKGTPIISDNVFDKLAEYYLYNEVGAKVDNGVTAKHYRRMYSLQKYYKDSNSENPLKEYKNLSYSPKLDGAAISLLYFNGVLVQVLTRGDGIEGQIITDKFLNTNLVPSSIKTSEVFVQVTGEIVAPSSTPNARNYASGALHLKDINEFKTRAITFFAHDMYPDINDTYEKDMQWLSRNNFSTIKDPDIHNIYPTDGIVYRINEHAIAGKLGFTSHHPKFAYALKERQETEETEILDVIWQTGRTGVVTPVAILKPVMVMEKEVTRASLHNKGFIESLDICIGDTVAIRLAGMIIPEVVHKVEA